MVPSYNNAAENRHFNNMDSILQQNYSNYHIVFIDDHSSDSTLEDMKAYFQAKALENTKLTFVANEQRKMALANIRTASN